MLRLSFTVGASYQAILEKVLETGTFYRAVSQPLGPFKKNTRCVT